CFQSEKSGSRSSNGIAKQTERYYYILPMKTISLKLPPALAKWLARKSKEAGRSQSDIVRQALEEQRQGQGRPSCHDLMQDLCGTLSGPSDLSSSPRHLQDFG